MSFTYTKLFSSITESTVWCEDNETRLLWICMLAMADRKGRVFGSRPGLANRARLPLEAVRKGLDIFLAPDPESRTEDFEGRRIVEIDGGWRLLNHDKYRQLRDEEEHKEQKRLWAAKNRAKSVDKKSTNVDSRGQGGQQKGEEKLHSRTKSNQAEADADADTSKNKKASIKDLILPEWLNKEAWAEFVAHRKEIRKPLSLLAGKKALNMLEGLEPKMQQQCIDRTIQSGWAGIFPRNEDKPNETAQRATTRPESNHGRVMRQLREASASS